MTVWRQKSMVHWNTCSHGLVALFCLLNLTGSTFKRAKAKLKKKNPNAEAGMYMKYSTKLCQ